MTVSQTNFAGGEFSPSLGARTGLEKYATAVKTMKNMFPHTHGGASNRGGTGYINAVKDATKESRLIEFEYSVYQNYILELGNQIMRLFTEGGQVVGAAGSGWYPNSLTDQVWTASGSGTNEYYMTVAPGDLTTADIGTWVYRVREDTDVRTEGTLGSLAAGEWGYGDNDTLGVDTIYIRLTDGTDPDTKSATYLEFMAVADDAIFELPLPYADTDLWTLNKTQSADTLYLFHKSYPVRAAYRLGHAFWATKAIIFGSPVTAPTGLSMTGTSKDYTVTAVNSSGEESVAATHTDGDYNNALTWTQVADADYYNVYSDSNGSGVFGWIGQAAQAASPQFHVPSTGIEPDYTFTPPQAEDPFGDADDYPAVGTFFEQRLVLARSNNSPQDFRGSVTGSYENFNKSRPVKNDDAYKFTISSRQVNEIRWMIPLTKLLIGTSGAEWVASNGANSDAITPSSVLVRQQSLFGASEVDPIVIGSSVIFVEASGKTVRDLAYSLEADSYTGGNLTLLANHLFDNFTLVDWAYQQSPDSIIWAVRDDGVLLGLTYLKEQDVFGWHRHETDGLYKSVASVRNADGHDDVYVVVERIVNGSTVKYVEIFKPRLPVRDDFINDIQDAFFVDSGLSLDSPLTITGATKADPVVITSVAHGLSDGDKVDIVEVKGMTELNGNRYTVANKATDTYELTDVDGNDIDGTAFTTYISSGKARKAVTAISGLGHLEGKAVAVLANGSVVEGLTVASGAITLPVAASRVHIGLPYTCDLETLNLEYPTETGTAQDKIRNVSNLVLRLHDTRSVRVGPDADNLDEIYFRVDEDYDEPTGLFTGDKDISIEPGEPREARVFIRVNEPVPITVLSIMARTETGEE